MSRLRGETAIQQFERDTHVQFVSIGVWLGIGEAEAGVGLADSQVRCAPSQLHPWQSRDICRIVRKRHSVSHCTIAKDILQGKERTKQCMLDHATVDFHQCYTAAMVQQYCLCSSQNVSAEPSREIQEAPRSIV